MALLSCLEQIQKKKKKYTHDSNFEIMKNAENVSHEQISNYNADITFFWKDMNSCIQFYCSISGPYFCHCHVTLKKQTLCICMIGWCHCNPVHALISTK